MSVLSISSTNYSHTREFHSVTRIGRKSRNVEAEAFDQPEGVQALVLRTLVAHDLLVDGTALELHDTAASLLLTPTQGFTSEALGVPGYHTPLMFLDTDIMI